MKKEIDYLIIEKYLQKELETEALLNFEKRLKEDVNFAKEVALYIEVNNTLTSRFSNYKEENNLRNTLEDLGAIHINNIEKVIPEKEVKVFSLMKYSKYLVAASLVLFASLVWMNNDKNSLNYNDYANHDTLELVVRGNNNTHLLKAEKAFNTQNYVLAQSELELLLQEDATKVELQLYLAICLVEQNKFELADSILTKIIKGNTIYKNKAIWNLGLSKLKQKDYPSCKTVLTSLPKSADDYMQAAKILKKL